MNEHYEIFLRNLPYIVREYNEALNIINDSNNKIFDVRDKNNKLIATSIINKNTVYLLCVNEEYRNKGIGTDLLNKSEEYILEQGYDSINIGVGDNYLMPGIPMKDKPYEEQLKKDNIYSEVNNNAYEFFNERGYKHSWKDANCFDMRADLKNTNFPKESIGDIIDGIEYRFATIEDIPSIINCTQDAENSFTPYYKNKEYYNTKSNQRVLIATKDNEVCGTLMVCIETEGKGLGSVGCTAVANKYRGQHIGVNMVILGTKYLKSLGLSQAYLGYTYSGLDKMYGYAGYEICIYYSMAKKSFSLNKIR